MSRKNTLITKNNLFVNNINKIVDANGGKSVFAEAIDVSYDAVRQWCIGENLPDGKRLLAIHEKFHVSIDWLLTGNEHGEEFMCDWPPVAIEACQRVKNILDSGNKIVIDALYTNLAAFEENISLKEDVDDLKKEMKYIRKIIKKGQRTGTD